MWLRVSVCKAAQRRVLNTLLNANQLPICIGKSRAAVRKNEAAALGALAAAYFWPYAAMQPVADATPWITEFETIVVSTMLAGSIAPLIVAR